MTTGFIEYQMFYITATCQKAGILIWPKHYAIMITLNGNHELVGVSGSGAKPG